MGALKQTIFSLYDDFFENYISERTRKSYRSDLNRFFGYLTDHYSTLRHLKKVEREHIVKYRNFLSETGGKEGNPCAPKTVARHLASLSSYFDYLVEKGERDFNPVKSVKRPRLEVLTPTQALTNDQVRAIFDLLEQDHDKYPSRIMHKALLVTFFTTGMRKNEVITLKYKNLRMINEDYVIEFMGKGGKSYQKLLHPLCIEAIDLYIHWMKTQRRDLEAEDWLFQPTRNPKDPSNLNKSLNPRTINEILQNYGKKIGLNFNISPHSARATFISELLDAGVDIYSVAREVNHSSVKTTQEYDKRRRRIKDSPIGKLRY